MAVAARRRLSSDKSLAAFLEPRMIEAAANDDLVASAAATAVSSGVHRSGNG